MSMRKEKEATKDSEKAIVRKFRQYVRIRPLMDEEKSKNTKVEKPEIVNTRSGVEYENGEVKIVDPKSLTPNATGTKYKAKKFSDYEGVFWSFGKDPWDAEGRDKTALEKEDIDHVYCDNADIYKDIKGDTIDMLFDGYNQSFTCYGPMNGGKTYTMNGTDRDPGIAPRIIRDFVDAIPTEKEKRQAPGENLEITIEAQVYRVYKEEIEDLLYGFPRLLAKTSDSCKLNANDMDKAFKLDISESQENFDALANRVWTGKECQNKVSKISTPNKNNRASVIIILTLKQKSTFSGEDHHGSLQVNSEKVSYLTLADIGYGGKSDGENANDFKKISNGQTNYQQLIRKLGEKGAGANTHVPFNTSAVGKLLTVAYQSSHATLICNISPWHKHAAETASFLEMAEYGNKAKSKVCPGDESEVSEFRENLHKEDNLKKEAKQEQNKMERVKQELASRMNRINELKHALLQAGLETEQWSDRNVQIVEEIAQLKDQFKNQQKDSEMILDSLDKREDKANKAKEEAMEKIAELTGNVKKLEEEMERREEKLAKVRELMNEVNSLKTMMTGKTDQSDGVEHDDSSTVQAVAIDDEEIGLFNTRSEESVKDLEAVIAKYKEHVTMSAENTKLLKEINTVLSELDSVKGEYSKVLNDHTRAKRRCIVEIWNTVEQFFKGSSLIILEIISKNTGRKDAKAVVDFFQGQYETITKLLGDGISKDTSPEKCPHYMAPLEEMVPVRQWIRSLCTGSGKTGDSSSAMGSSLEGTGTSSHGLSSGSLDVSKVSQEEIETVYGHVKTILAWGECLVNYNSTYEAIDSSLMTFTDVMPFWSSRINEAVKIHAETEELNAKAEEIEGEVDALNKEILQEEAKLAAAEKTVKAKQAKVTQLKAELKKKKEGCTIL